MCEYFLPENIFVKNICTCCRGQSRSSNPPEPSIIRELVTEHCTTAKIKNALND